MPAETKTCEECGKTITRMPWQNNVIWERVRYCPNKCQLIAQSRRQRERRKAGIKPKPAKRDSLFAQLNCRNPPEHLVRIVEANAFEVRQSWYAGCAVEDHLN